MKSLFIDLTLALYDLTSVRFHGGAKVEGDFRELGLSKDLNGTGRQFVLCMVQTADGLPLLHRVHKGNITEAKTFRPMAEALLDTYSISRIVAVADRGLLSKENVESLTEIAASSGRNLQFILGDIGSC